MRIDLCLVSSDLNENYVGLYPYIRKAWNKFGIETKMILVSTYIPETLKNYSDEIILFKPLENIHTAFQAQTIRLLYPCLFNNLNIIISDMDIIPLSKDYFINSVKNFSNDKFIIYRDAYIDRFMYAICYNLANTITWKNIFKINSLDDIKSTLKSWYNHDYSGEKNCIGWFTDQNKLFQYVNQYNKNIIILKDKHMKFSRLDKRKRTYIINNLDKVYNDIKEIKYTDFHIIRPYYKHLDIINKIIHLI